MVVWNAEADAKLLASVFNECGVTLSQEQYKKLADVMGCTPKAITHRVAKFRKGIALNPGGGSPGPAAPVPRKRAAAATGGKKKGKAAKADTPEDDVEEAGLATPPPTGGKKRVQAEDDDGDEEGNLLSKKVKIEVGEDIGEGLRAMVNGAESEDESQ